MAIDDLGSDRLFVETSSPQRSKKPPLWAASACLQRHGIPGDWSLHVRAGNAAWLANPGASVVCTCLQARFASTDADSPGAPYPPGIPGIPAGPCSPCVPGGPMGPTLPLPGAPGAPESGGISQKLLAAILGLQLQATTMAWTPGV